MENLFNFQTNYIQLIEKNNSNDLAIHFIGENYHEEKITYKELNLRVNAFKLLLQIFENKKWMLL